MKYFVIGMMVCLLSACAHKADLKTPTQIENEQRKAEKKAAKDEARKAKEAAKNPAPEKTNEPMEVTAP